MKGEGLYYWSSEVALQQFERHCATFLSEPITRLYWPSNGKNVAAEQRINRQTLVRCLFTACSFRRCASDELSMCLRCCFSFCRSSIIHKIRTQLLKKPGGARNVTGDMTRVNMTSYCVHVTGASCTEGAVRRLSWILTWRR